MTFHTRNAYYLRISSNNVLPLYLYLDERHLDWMSDSVLQHVLADLRPLIVPKLQAEVDVGSGGLANTKKGTVDVKRGDFYQFAYFLGKTEPHSVLIKMRSFSAALPQPKQIPPASKPQSAKGKRKPNATSENFGQGRKKRKTKGKGRARMDESDDEELAISSGDDNDTIVPRSTQFIGEAPRRSGRVKKLVAGGYKHDEGDANHVDTDANEDIHMTIAPSDLSVDDVQMVGLERSQSTSPTVIEEEGQANVANPLSAAKYAQPEQEDAIVETEPPEIELIVDEEEPKPKPLLQLKYQGFNIFGNCLCVVVEPWPPIRAVSRAPSIAPIFSNPVKAASTSSSDVVPSGQLEPVDRERTPLFLPDPDRGRSETPTPFIQSRVLPPVPLFSDAMDPDINGDALMEFSQTLNYAGDYRGGPEDDEIDGAVLFGDADEWREF